MPERKLTQEQEQAVVHTGSPLLIVAGAGTGKTTVITQKIVHLIKHKQVKPEEILALTFTNKAALEMLTRVEDELGLTYSDVPISTFHAFCERLLERHGLDIGLPVPCKLLTELEAWLLVKEQLKSFSLDYYRPLGNPTRHIHELIKHFAACKDALISPEMYLAYAETVQLDADLVGNAERSRYRELAHAYHRYQKLLLEKNFLDFADLIYYSVRLLEERPAMRARLQTRFKYILVDEFQDVNYAQYRLVQLLSGSGDQLTIVGDDDQSIYAFRGASVANILRFKDDFPRATPIVLTKNYRSFQSILDGAYRVIQHNNPDRLEAKLAIDKRLHAERGDAPAAIEHLAAAHLEMEVNMVVERIMALGKSGVPWNEIALLARASSHAEPFVAALRQQGIPYNAHMAKSLYQQPIVINALCFLRALINSHDAQALFRLLQLPVLILNELDQQKLIFSAKKKAISYYEALQRAAEFGLSNAGITGCAKLVSLIKEGVGTLTSQKPSHILYTFLDHSGYLRYLAHEETMGSGEILEAIEMLSRFFERVVAYETHHPTNATVHEFLEFHENLLEAGDDGETALEEDVTGGVNIMTVHASKGLEFRHVFIVNVVEERFPLRARSEPLAVPPELLTAPPMGNDAHYQEERRLFYVALTRAKEKVYLSSAENYGGARAKRVSRFLIELGFDTPRESRELGDSPSEKIKKPSAPGAAQSVYEIGNTFSFSQLRSYETCPYQYKLNYVLKIPTKGSPHFSFGQTMHLTLQKFFTRVQELNSARQASLFSVLETPEPTSKTPTLEELMSLYQNSWIEDWYISSEQREAYYKKGKEILTTLYKEHERNVRIPIVLEGWFKIRVGNYFLNGRIDRIDRLPDGALEIIDYKTGQAKDKLTGEDKEQLLIYQIAAEQLPEYRNQGTVSALTFYYLNDNVKLSFRGTASELEKLKEKIVEIIERIRAKDFTPTPNSFICNHCDFRSICEFRV